MSAKPEKIEAKLRFLLLNGSFYNSSRATFHSRTKGGRFALAAANLQCFSFPNSIHSIEGQKFLVVKL